MEEEGQKSKAIDRLKSYVQLLKDVRVKDLQHQTNTQTLQDQLSEARRKVRELNERLPKGEESDEALAKRVSQADLSKPEEWALLDKLLPAKVITALRAQTAAAVKESRNSS